MRVSIFNMSSLVAVCKFLHAGKYALAINLLDTFLLPVTLPALPLKSGAIFCLSQKFGRREGRAALPSGKAVVPGRERRDSGRAFPAAPARGSAAGCTAAPTGAEGGGGPGGSAGQRSPGDAAPRSGTARLSWECAAGPGGPTAPSAPALVSATG